MENLKQPNFDIIGPQGTFGRWFFTTSDARIAIKKSIKSKNKGKIEKEAKVYQLVKNVIDYLSITHLKTLDVVHFNTQYIYSRLYPPKEQTNLIEIDYSINYVGDSTNTWNTFNPDIIIEKDILSAEIVNTIIPYELGKIWLGMVILHKKVLWEPEIAIATKVDTEKNEIFLIDFDKTLETTDDYRLAVSKDYKIPIYHVLTNIFPSPGRKQYEKFKEGMIYIGNLLNKSELSSYIVDGLEKLVEEST